MYLQKGLHIINDETKMLIRIITFHVNMAPSLEAIALSVIASIIPAIVPEGQIYLQKNGVNLKQIGSMMTHAARITYLRYLNALSPLKRFFLKGKGIRLISS